MDNQKATSMKKKQNASIKSHSKTRLLSEDQKDSDQNSVSERLSLLNNRRFQSDRNVMESRNSRGFKQNKFKPKPFKTNSLNDELKHDSLNSVSNQLSLLNINGSHLNRNMIRDKLCIKNIDKYKQRKNRSPQYGVHSDRLYSIPDSNNREIDFSQEIERIKERGKGLGSQCSSLCSSASSLMSYKDSTERNINQKIDCGNKKCHPDWRNKKSNNHFTSHLSNHFIKTWVQKNDDTLTHLIIKNKDGYKNLFCNHRRVNDMIVVFDLLNRICEINDPSTKRYFLSFSLNEQFIENIDSYLSCVLLGSSKDMLKNLEYLIKYYSEIIEVIPSENLDNYHEHFIGSLEKMEKISHIPDLMINNIKDLITNISEKINELNTELDVSNLSILPSPDDINEIPELQPNITTGPYQSVSQYLNIHFKLLKEDFVCNLRSGLLEYENNLKENKSSRIKDIFVYDAVYCGLMKHSRKSNLVVSFEIDNKKLKKVDWRTSKRLTHGSLLLISNDNFKTYYLTLFDDKKTPKNDDKHFVISALIVNKLIKFKKYTKCTIIEPRVFFNPYFQVLKTIKKIDPNIFPMEKYITQVSTEINAPVYIKDETNYLIEGHEININNMTSFEYPEIFGLNEFQISALQAALTKEFVIIQGPPGTGKSYLGLKIINILLDNSLRWKKDESPILVICYRNNAVDQILESLIKDGKKIVRLGNQSNNTHVKDCCLRNAIRTVHTKPVLRDQISTIKNQIETLKSHISEMLTIIDIVNDKKAVLTIDSLSDVLTIAQKQYLSKSNVFEEWLFGGYDECDNDETLMDNLQLDNSEYNFSFNERQSSLIFLSITGLINELCDLERKIDFIYSSYDHIHSKGQDVLLDVVEILQEYGKKEFFLKKVLNRINLDIDNFIDITKLNPDDLFELSIPERWMLYKHWADLFCKQCKEKIDKFLDEINDKQNTLDELHDMSDGYKVLQLRPDVVGATTTGAARTRSLLTVIQPKIGRTNIHL